MPSHDGKCLSQVCALVDREGRNGQIGDGHGTACETRRARQRQCCPRQEQLEPALAIEDRNPAQTAQENGRARDRFPRKGAIDYTTGRESTNPTGRTAATAGGNLDMMASAIAGMDRRQSTTRSEAVSRAGKAAKGHVSHREVATY